MLNDVQRVLLSEKDIALICERLGKQISTDYAGKQLILVGLLKGCNPFLSDLARKITIPLELNYMKASSYEGTKSSGNIRITLDLDIDVKDKDILIVEDIVDTGSTLTKVIGNLKARNPKSIKVVALLDKPDGRTVKFEADYVGTIIPKEFVIGYGLDYNEKYRNLPFIGILKKEVYMK